MLRLLKELAGLAVALVYLMFLGTLMIGCLVVDEIRK